MIGFSRPCLISFFKKPFQFWIIKIKEKTCCHMTTVLLKSSRKTCTKINHDKSNVYVFNKLHQR